MLSCKFMMTTLLLLLLLSLGVFSSMKENVRWTFRATCSGHDGTVRMWNIPNKTHAFLQQTCVFYRGEDVHTEEMDGYHLSNLCWNSNGRLLAASHEDMINIWAVGGRCASAVAVLSDTVIELVGCGGLVGGWGETQRVSTSLICCGKFGSFTATARPVLYSCLPVCAVFVCVQTVLYGYQRWGFLTCMQL